MNATKLTAAIMVCSLALSFQAVHAQSVVYQAGKVVTMNGQPLAPGQVLVVDGKIAQVASRIAREDPQTQLVDLGSEVTLIPGLIDAYSQTAIAGGENEFSDEVTPQFDISTAIPWQSPQLRRELTAGTTTIHLCPGTQNVVCGTSALIKLGGNSPAVSLLGDSGALLISVCEDPSQRNNARQRPDGLYVRQPTNRMGVVWILRSTLDKVTRNQAVAGGEVLQEALDGQRKILAVSRTRYDLNTLLTVSKEFGFAPVAVGAHEAYHVADALAQAGVPVILQPLTTSDSMRGPEQTELCWNQAELLLRAGVKVALSGGNLLEQARFAHRFGLDADTALAAVTRNPAEILGVDQRVGRIAPGADADMIAIHGDPLEFTSSIRWVMVDGKIVEPIEDQ